MALKTRILSSMAKVFLDENPSNYLEIKSMSAFKNEKAAFQICLFSDEFLDDIRIEISEYVKIYRVNMVPAVKVTDRTSDDYYLRKTPGLYPDILKPYNGETFKLPKDIYITFWVEAENLPAGKHTVEFKVFDKENEVLDFGNFIFNIIDCNLPEQSLVCTNWFHCDSIAEYYKIPVFSEEFWRIAENFLKTAVEHGINFILTPLFTPPLDTMIGGERLTVQLVKVTVTESGYKFNFDLLVKWIRLCKKCGVKYFEMSHLFTQWGALHAPKIIGEVNGEEKPIFGWNTDSTGEEYKIFLTALAPELTKVLESEGVADYTYFHVSDEPAEKDIEVYGKLSGLMNELFGKRFKIFDALSDVDFYDKGYSKIPVPVEANIEEFIGKVPELWTYYCCGPCDNYYSNRFLSMPLQRTRVIGMQLYKYGVKGFLHWGYNFYYSCLSVRKVIPFAETDSDCAFSAGDAFVVYPSDDGTALPSIRLKAMNEGFQDMRALQLLESKIGKEKTLEILEDDCGNKFKMTFTDYPRSEKWHFYKRQEINKKIKELL